VLHIAAHTADAAVRAASHHRAPLLLLLLVVYLLLQCLLLPPTGTACTACNIRGPWLLLLLLQATTSYNVGQVLLL
jgi:hypothetical protein